MTGEKGIDPLADLDAEILAFLQAAGIETSAVQLSVPTDRAFGERSTNVAFQLARERRMAPKQIAEQIAGGFDPADYRYIMAVEPAGAGFLNFRLNYQAFVPRALEAIREAGPVFGRRPDAHLERVVVEHTSVNPNKEWHVGHVRNAVLGDVVARLLRLAGHDVQVQNYIDDTGPQAAQAVYAFQQFQEPRQPAEKFDHYVGRHYVKVAAEIGAEAHLQARLQEMDTEDSPTDAAERRTVEARLENIQRLKQGVVRTMKELEHGEYFPLVQQILEAQLETGFRLGVFYDLLNWESHLVESHIFDDAIARLEGKDRIYRPSTGRYAGALVIQTGEAVEGEEPKCEVLIRSNGLPTYVGKDIAYHMWKFHLLPDPLKYVDLLSQPNGKALRSTSLHGDPPSDPPPDEVINVIGVHQTQAQAAVREALRVAGFQEAADELIHLDYGMVSTAAGKISGRKGTSVAGDAVIEEAVGVALDRVRERGQDLTEEEMRRIAEAVGIGAIRYFMVAYNPLRDIVFDVGDVVSYDGNTGLYVQYALVRMYAILRKAAQERGIQEASIDIADATLLQHEQEKRLIFHLALFPSTVADAARTRAVNLVAEYAFDLAGIFSQFYRDCTVLDAEAGLREARLLLVRTVRDVLGIACGVLGVPVIERL